MRILAQDSLVFVVDMQEKLVVAMHEKEELIERNITLLNGARAMELPIMLSQQYTKGLGNTLAEIYEAAGTTDFYEKKDFSCWDDEGIRKAIEATGKKNIIVTGTEAHVCVLQTCMDMKAAGLNPILVVDCIGSRKKNDRKFGVKRAMQEGITVTTAEAVLFELLRSAKSPYFRDISAIVK